MSILNPSMNKMIAELVGMPPQQLAQYAAANQNDTMKFLAAKAASDMQKKQMAAGAAQQQQPAAPPVAEQVVQQMAQGLPEDSGIGALPAPNMRGYAAGGIVAFAEGGINAASFGEYLRSQGVNPSDFSRMSETARQTLRNLFSNATMGPQVSAPAPAANVPAAPSAPSAPSNPYAPATPGSSYAETKSPLQRLLSGPKGSVMGSAAVPAAVAAGGAKLSSAAANTLNAMSDEDLEIMTNAGGGDDTALAAAILREGRNNPTPAAPKKPVEYRGSKDIPYTGTGVPSASAAALRGGASTQASQKAQSDQSAATRADTGTARSAPGGTTAPVQKAGESSEAMWNRIYNAMPGARANLPPEIQEAEDIRTAQAGKELASEKEAATGLAALMGKREARIGEREKRLADKSSNDVNMALIDAGLAMMQSRGQGLAGIAEGAGVGMKRYAEDTKATEAARQKIEEARDAYDDLKFNREDMSRKQILAAEGKIADAKVATKSANVAEIARREGVNQKTAGHIYDAEQAKLLQEQTQQFQAGENAKNRATQVSVANAPNGQMQLAAALGNGNIEAGMRKITEIAAGKFNMQEAYANYMKSMGPGGMGLAPQEFAAQIRALTPQIRP